MEYLATQIPALVSQFGSVQKRIKVLSGTKPPPIPITLSMLSLINNCELMNEYNIVH
jgi:hypothetical protein